MAERRHQDGPPPLVSLAAALRANLDDPRRLAEALIRGQLGATGVFLGEGTADCPWIMFGRDQQFYGFYLRGRELMQVVRNEPDKLVGYLGAGERGTGRG